MTNGNDPAFARSAAEYEDMDGLPKYNEPSDGLTKREYFAAMAMQGLIAHGYNNGVAAAAVTNADDLIAALIQEAK